MKKTLIASLLAACSLSSIASDFYVVVPVPNRTGAAIQVALGQSSLPSALVGIAYSYDFKQNLQVLGDTAYSGYGVKWSVESGSLPAGLTLNKDTGVVSGTPTTKGTASFVLNVTYKKKTGSASYQIPVSLAVSVALAAATPPQAVVGTTYIYDLKSLLSVAGDNAYNGSGVTWTVVSSTLPAGLSLRTDGTIAGTPTAAGNGQITARATYKGANGEQTYQVVALNINVVLSAATLPAVIAGNSYSYDFKSNLAVTGDPSYTASNVTWSLAGGALPAGLALSSNGVVSGTGGVLSNSGTSFTLKADYRSKSSQRSYTLYPGDANSSDTAVLMHLDALTDEKGHTVTNNGVTLGSIAGTIGSGSAYFSGASSCSFSVAGVAAPGNVFTLEMWFYPTGAPGTTYNLLWDSRSSTDSNLGINLRYNSSYIPALAYMGGGQTDVLGSTALTPNAWNHLAVVRDGLRLTLYLNGHNIGQNNNFTRTLSHSSFLVGRAIDLTYGAKGYMDELRYTPGVARYSGDFTPPAYELPNN